MKDLRTPRRRLLVSASLVAIVTAVALTLVPTALNSNTPNGLAAYVTVSNRGPLVSCADGTCLNAQTQLLVHVVNANQLKNWVGYTSRTSVPNAFVVNSVDLTAYANGKQFGDPLTLTPPINANFKAWSGHWPATVICSGSPGSFTDPCDIVENPAVLPGEATVVVYGGWWHYAAEEPNGKYVFKYTVHGTLNGSPVDVTATSQQITMTG